MRRLLSPHEPARLFTRGVLAMAIALSCSFGVSSEARAEEPAPEVKEPKNDPRARAQQLFDSALTDAEAGNFAAACPKFLASQEADPKTSTLLNLASCYEKNGQTASAWGAFREAEIRARKTSRTDWETSARARADALEAKLLRLSVNVAESHRVTGLTVSRDGARLAPGEWGVAIPVDPGTHVISASAEGHKPWETRIDVRDPTSTIEVPRLDRVPDAPLLPPPPMAAPPAKHRWSPLETTGAIVAGSGVVTMVVAGLVGLSAKGDYNDARAQCSDGARGCPTRAVNDSEAAYDTASAATVVFIAGIAQLVGGAALFLFAPGAHSSTSESLSPPRGASVALSPGGISGRF